MRSSPVQVSLSDEVLTITYQISSLNLIKKVLCCTFYKMKIPIPTVFSEQVKTVSLTEKTTYWKDKDG